jgi:hypothetical protein
MPPDNGTPHVLDLGRRIELVSMDRHWADITIGLYRAGDPPRATVHSYSRSDGVEARLAWLGATMATFAGLERDAAAPRTVWFGCGGWHELGMRRTFLEACKPDPTVPVEARPLAVEDSRSGQRLGVEALGDGRYRVSGSAVASGETDRALAVAAGLVKLLDLEPSEDDPTLVRFACGGTHDALVGLLLPRAINVRATLRELEAAAARGLLVAPSAQAQSSPA